MTKRVMWNRPKNKGPFPTFSQVNELSNSSRSDGIVVCFSAESFGRTAQ